MLKTCELTLIVGGIWAAKHYFSKSEFPKHCLNLTDYRQHLRLYLLITHLCFHPVHQSQITYCYIYFIVNKFSSFHLHPITNHQIQGNYSCLVSVKTMAEEQAPAGGKKGDRCHLFAFFPGGLTEGEKQRWHSRWSCATHNHIRIWQSGVVFNH